MKRVATLKECSDNEFLPNFKILIHLETHLKTIKDSI